MPDEGTAPLRRAVGRAKYLRETERWAERQARERAAVQYVLLLDAPQRIRGRSYWPLEVRAGDKLWKRFLVSPDAKRSIENPR